MSFSDRPTLLGFGEFTVHRVERSLRKCGIRLKLHGQSFEILLLLLEHPGEVVTRQEIQAKLWSRDVFVDFENGLNAAVKKLRQTLGDSAEAPRYIETLPRVGYRFLIPVISLDTTIETHLPASDQLPRVASASTAKTYNYRLRILVAASVLILGIFITVGFRRNSALALKPTDLVLVSDFLNTTGDPVFDDTLKRALQVKLSESPNFDVLNEYNLRETLRLMQRSMSDKLLPPFDREVCQRAGAKVAIGGSIVNGPGQQYLITVSAKNCLTGVIVAQQQGRSPNRERVLATLGDLIFPIRRKLGESLATIEKFNTPILEATTPSLSALKAYTLGDEMRLQGRDAESGSFYRMAVELDPNFAIAYARLGTLYGNLSKRELSEQYLKKAFDLRNHVSEKEKFYIAAHYYTEFTREVDKSVQTYELWTQTYPSDWIPFNNLADVTARSGFIEKAVAAGEEALRLNPNSWFTYQTLANAYLRASRFADAKTICNRAIAENHIGMTTNTALRVALIENNQVAVDQMLAAAKGKSNEAALLTYSSARSSDRGKLRSTRSLALQAEKVALQQGMREQASDTAFDESLVEAELGYAGEARAALKEALLWNPEPAVRGYAALTIGRLGDANGAEKYLKVANVNPLDTIHNAVVLASARAAIDLDLKNPQQAIEDLKSALPYDRGEISNGQTLYLRGLAYLQAGLGADAIAQFQELIDNHGSAISIYWPLGHLGLARAYVLNGQMEKALNAYQAFLDLWNDADPDLPVLQQARAEYQKLSKSH